jgi:RimJ/RimL family protein N-acetyltransferase
MSATMAKDMGHEVSRLLNPSPSFKHFVYNEAKIMNWASHLVNDPLYVEDYARDYNNVYKLIGWFLFGDAMNLTYEIGDGGGALTISSIIPGHKAKIDWYMWDKTLWTKGFARECKALVDMVMAQFNLKRIWSNTANPKIAKFVQCFGAKIEGMKKGDFMFDGKRYDSWMLALESQSEEK